MSNRPAISVKSNVSWSISIAGWSGEKGPSFKINKRYKDKESGEYKDTVWLNPQDLAAIALLIPEALQAIKQYEAERQSVNADTSSGDASLATISASKGPAEDEDSIPF